MQLEEVLDQLNKMSNPKNVEGMKRFGIKHEKNMIVHPLQSWPL